MVTTKPGQKIQIDTLKAALRKLEQLEEKPKEELSLRESIYFLRDKLHSALKKGYSYQDLSALLAQQGILVSAATLKQYLTEIDKEKRSKKRVTKSEQVKQTSTEENIPNSSSTLSESELTESSLTSSVKSKVNKVQSDSPQKNHELTDEKKQTDDREQEQETTKPAKQKQRRTSKSNTDVSNEFNQY